jgi:exopolyphosphatase / guanosine-5'-triphosphate,3'-diphosphate pyrophosphatase
VTTSWGRGRRSGWVFGAPGPDQFHSVILGGVTEDGALAALDCGTNSTRLLVVGPSGELRAREMTITRLGEGVDDTHRLAPEAVERTLAALRAYRAIMDAEDVVRARLVATSAVRDASNSSAFLVPATDVIGAPAELLSGKEEGRLSYYGATSDLPPGGGAVVVVDIGGGSTELATRSAEDVLSVSLDIGCVRLTERFLHADPPNPAEVTQAVQAIGAELDRAAASIPPLDDTARTRQLVGLAGTVSTLASLELGLDEYDGARIHHAVLTEESVGRWCEVLGGEPVAQRALRPGLPVGRQDVIFGGALVLREVMRRFAFSRCTVSETDILDGLILSMQGVTT